LTAIDTFGKFTEIGPVRDDSPDERRWSLFTLSDPSGISPMGSDWFFLPNTVVNEQKGEAIEEVQLCRDELANLVWAIERTYSDESSGAIVDRDDARQPGSFHPEEGAFLPMHRLKSDVPPHWVPYVPVQHGLPGTIILRRGRTDPEAAATPDADNFPGKTQYKGRILRESQTIFEEEVPAGAIILTRRFKKIASGRERWILEPVDDKWRLKKVESPQAVIWLGRMKKRGPRVGASGLTFDYLVERR
jgi:hypothetical protein